MPTEYVQVQAPPQQRSAGGSIVGGIAGACSAARSVRGNGRTAAAAAGAIAGAVVGDRVDNQNNYQGGMQEQAVKQCRQVDHWESRNNGYQVTYDYRGRNYTSIMSYDPGERIRCGIHRARSAYQYGPVHADPSRSAFFMALRHGL